MDQTSVFAMDAFIPPIFNLSVYDGMDSLYYNWNRVNHDAQPDRASSRNMMFKNKNRPFDRLIEDENNILKSWDDEESQWIDFCNFPVFERRHHEHPSLLSNAFFFNNFVARTFHDGAKNMAKIEYPRNWERAVYGEDSWTLSFGFTHCRPIAPQKYAVLLYKKESIEVRITTDTERVSEEEKDGNYCDLTPNEGDIEDGDRQKFETVDSGTKYKWTEERLEVMVHIHCDGKMKEVVLCSYPIRHDFGDRDAFHEVGLRVNKKFVFAENRFDSHVVIVSKTDEGQIRCFVDGMIVCDNTVERLAGKRNGRSNMLGGKESSILVAHKPGSKEGSAHGLFHGYLYGVALHALALDTFELNTLYRQLRVHRDLHTASLWLRNKSQISNVIYKQFL